MSELASAFLTSFSAEKNGILVRLFAMLPPSECALLVVSEIARGIEEKRDAKDLLSALTKLRKDFVEANSMLPSYDLRQCELVSITSINRVEELHWDILRCSI